MSKFLFGREEWFCMKVVAIIQARMASTRLPGKVLKEVNGKTLLAYQLERVQRSKFINKIVIATTINEADEPIVELCKKLGVAIYRGSEEDVLKRYYEAAKLYNAEVIVRLTSDCPLIDPDIIDEVIKHFNSKKNLYDYVSNTLERTFPRGLDVEVFSFKALKNANENATRQQDREHVTAYFYTNPKNFRLSYIKNGEDFSKHRWTVDTPEDFKLIQLILTSIYLNQKNFALRDVIQLLNDNLHWNLINADIEQKKI